MGNFSLCIVYSFNMHFSKKPSLKLTVYKLWPFSKSVPSPLPWQGTGWHLNFRENSAPIEWLLERHLCWCHHRTEETAGLLFWYLVKVSGQSRVLCWGYVRFSKCLVDTHDCIIMMCLQKKFKKTLQKRHHWPWNVGVWAGINYGPSLKYAWETLDWVPPQTLQISGYGNGGIPGRIPVSDI